MKTIFISHASANAERALQVAGLLESAGLSVRMDRQSIGPGDSFIQFMESALSHADVCLLLWSSAAAESVYVTEEWQAALNKTLVEQRAFLMIARLEPEPVPTLVSHRLYVDLFPELEPGLSRLIDTLRMDAAVAATYSKPVARAAVELDDTAAGVEVYVMSELFDTVAPFQVDTTKPVAAITDGLVDALDLPRQLSHRDRIRLTFSYGLRVNGVDLDRRERVNVLGVQAGDVLELMTTTMLQAAVSPEEGQLHGAKFKDPEAAGLSKDDVDEAMAYGRAAQLEKARIVGLHSPCSDTAPRG